MAPRYHQNVYFELFWALVAKCLPDGLWRLILECSGPWWQNSSQMTSGDSFWGALGAGGRMAPRWPLEVHFELFWALVATWLSDGPWRGIFRSCELW